MSNFVELGLMDVKVAGMDVTIRGEAMLRYDDDAGYTYSARVNTHPNPSAPRAVLLPPNVLSPLPAVLTAW